MGLRRRRGLSMASGMQGLASAVGAQGERTLADRAFAALHDATLTGQLEPAAS